MTKIVRIVVPPVRRVLLRVWLIESLSIWGSSWPYFPRF
jgi:hypothetical protein